MKKGTSLPINTVIIFILAALVLAVSLMILFDRGLGSLGLVDDKMSTLELCNKYTNQDPTCQNPSNVDSTLKNDLRIACSESGHSECQVGVTPECLQSCCVGCP